MYFKYLYGHNLIL